MAAWMCSADLKETFTLSAQDQGRIRGERTFEDGTGCHSDSVQETVSCGGGSEACHCIYLPRFAAAFETTTKGLEGLVVLTAMHLFPVLTQPVTGWKSDIAGGNAQLQLIQRY